MRHRHAPKQKEYEHQHGEQSSEKAHKHLHRHVERRRLLLAITLTGSMMVVELIGGVLTNSLALISDAGHMLTHFFALTVSYFAIRFASRPAPKEKSFGFYRIEVLAALFNGLTLLVITGFIFWEAYKRILEPRPIAELQMFWVAVAGLIVNLLTAAILWGAGKEDLNVKSAFIHMLGDTASSMGIVIGAIVIYFSGWFIIDPILSIVIAAVILIWAIGLLKDSMNILLEAAPKHIKVGELEDSLRARFPSIRELHDIHIWEITSKMYAMTAHVGVRNMSVNQTQELRKSVNEYLSHKYDIEHVILQFETDSKDA